MALTPEQLAALPGWLQALQNKQYTPGVNLGDELSDKGGSTSNFGETYLDPTTNRWYMPYYSYDTTLSVANGGQQEGGGQGQLLGYKASDNSRDYEGKTNYLYDTNGKQTDTFKSNNSFFEMEPSEMLAIAAIAAMTAGAGAAALGPAAGAAGGAGGEIGSGAAFNAAMDSQLANVALGSEALSGYTGVAGLGGAQAAGGGGIFNAAMDSQLANAALGSEALAGYGGSVSPAVSGLGGASSGGGLFGGGGGAGGGGLGSLLGGGGGNGLGQLATLAGGLLGSQGQQQGQTSTRDVPEWMKPYLTGQGGLFPLTQQQLGRDYSADRIAQRDGIRNIGLGLLGKPMAGNPTANWQFPR